VVVVAVGGYHLVEGPDGDERVLGANREPLLCRVQGKAEAVARVRPKGASDLCEARTRVGSQRR